MVHPASQPLPTGLDTPDDEGAEPQLNDAPERREALLDASFHGVRADKALVAMAPEFSRNHLQSLIEQGHVQLNGRLLDSPARKVLAGQLLVIELVPTPESRAFRPEAMPLNVVFEDEHMLVINKPAGLVVHPAAGHWSGTLLNGLLARYPASAALPRAGIVHRLDKDTSGLMVVGKTLPAVTALVRAISARAVQREYLALVNGRLRLESMHIDAPLGRDPASRIRMAVLSQGRPSQTDVTRLNVASFETGDVSAVRCKLHTGRTHQIRVHLSSNGHPLLSDALYGGRPGLGLLRQALHATRLGLAHPDTGQWMVFDAPLPTDLADAWELVTGARGVE